MGMSMRRFLERRKCNLDLFQLLWLNCERKKWQIISSQPVIFWRNCVLLSKTGARSEEGMRAVDLYVSSASNPAFGHLALCQMCRWGQTLSFRRCRVCEPGLDMCCQRAVTPDLSPKTLTQPSPILFTPSNHMPLCPVHWPDGCLIKSGGIYSGKITTTRSFISNKTSWFCAVFLLHNRLQE